MPLYALPQEVIFPPPHLARTDGLLAVGGDLSPKRLLLAYQSGIFPWFSEGDPILWWSPNPRFILHSDHLKVSKSMRQVLRRKTFEISFDQDFSSVIRACSQIPRKGQEGTWITTDMMEAYIQLHELGFAHSVEVWKEGKLVGGLYGISLGKCFFGESMFTRQSNASKAGFITLVQQLRDHDFEMIDCQIHTPHLESLGGKNMPRKEYLEWLAQEVRHETQRGNWGEWLEVTP